MQLRQGGLGKGEDDPGPGLLQGVLDQVPAGNRIQGHRHRPGQERPEVAHGPFRAVLQENGHPVAGLHPLGLEPAGHGQTAPVKLAVGILPDRVAGLINNGDPIGGLPGHRGKLAGQGLHGGFHNFWLELAGGDARPTDFFRWRRLSSLSRRRFLVRLPAATALEPNALQVRPNNR